jgi:DNA-binding response OmpR family regulator
MIETSGEQTMAHILVVDDDTQVLSSVAQVLERAGHVVSMASNGQQALDLIAANRPELVVLDIIMPEMDGIEVCRRIRADPFLAALPVLFLTAKGRSSEVAQGLDIGGDDYLIKPFDVVELPARVRALLRRMPGGPLDPESKFLAIGDLRLNRIRPEVRVGDQLVQLTSIEHRLLHYLMLNTGQPQSTDRLLEDVWGYPPGTGDPKLIHAHISNLRTKIELQPNVHRQIHNVRGRGYLVSE